MHPSLSRVPSPSAVARSPFARAFEGKGSRTRILALLGEVLLVTLWALWMGRNYLDFDPQVWPSGRELGLVIRTHYIWTLLPQCGDCIFWNGFFNGGSPSFAELQGAVLHPLVILTTLLWGSVNGTKMLLVCSLAMAGYAQLWLSRVLDLGRISRLWTALIAVAGGHLAARMEHGVVGLVLSTAACSLVFPPALDVIITGRRRSALLTAFTAALALLSGQGYLQIGLLFCVLPAFVIAILIKGRGRRHAVKGLLLVAILTTLLSAPLWVPFGHSLPHFTKDQDLLLGGIQPLEYLPLNLVIRDTTHYYRWSLGRLGYPYLYGNYIGWLPVLLALLVVFRPGFSKAKSIDVLAMVLSIILIYLLASGVVLKLLRPLAPDLVTSIRYPSVISGLAVTPLLGLSGVGLERVLVYIAGKERSPGHSPFLGTFGAKQLLILILLLWSIVPVQGFSQTWLTEYRAPTVAYQIADDLRTPTPQWVEFPYGRHFWAIPALEAGLKTTGAFSPWHWQGRALPAAHWGYDEQRDDIVYPEEGAAEYAFVEQGNVRTTCEAFAKGGHIDVTCNLEEAGQLWVMENAWTGWQGWVDGKRTDLIDAAWLSVNAPAGSHHFRFRYRPLDVPIGLGLGIVGSLVLGVLWVTPLARVPGLPVAEEIIDAAVDTASVWLGSLRRRARDVFSSPYMPGHRESVATLTLISTGAAAVSVAIIVIGSILPYTIPLLLQRILAGVFILATIANGVIFTTIRRSREKTQTPPQSGENHETRTTDRAVG